MTEFKSRRELREAERQGLVQKPEQIFDLPTGQIDLPGKPEAVAIASPDVASVDEMLTRKRIREMERQGLLDPLTGTVLIPPTSPTLSPQARSYDEVLAETEEPITASINAVSLQSNQTSTNSDVNPPIRNSQPIPETDIFHSMAIDVKARKPRVSLILPSILVVLAGLGAAAYMLGIFK